MSHQELRKPLRTLIVDDEPLAVERLQVICAGLDALAVVGTASDGAAALRLAAALKPDLVLLDLTMPEVDGMTVARELARRASCPAIIFVTAHDEYAVEAFDLDAVDYVLKPVRADRLARAVERACARAGAPPSSRGRPSDWLEELWIPHRAELVRIAVEDVLQIDAERDYVRLHLGDRSYLMLQTIAGLEAKLDPARFIRIHRSTIVRRDRIRGLRHDGLGTWMAELSDGTSLRIGRTFLARVKSMAGR
jgi:two-component system response regulator AlgR